MLPVMRISPPILTLAALSLVTASNASANLLANPGFESPITFDGAPFVGFWEGFSSGAGATSANGAITPLSGAQHLFLDIDATDNAFAGAFQDVVGLTPGLSYIFSGWSMSPTAPLPAGFVEIRIEWRDSINNVEISRTPNFDPSPTSTYSLFSVEDVAPAGADSARLVMAIQTFGLGNTGSLFVDDTAFNAAVPEPATSMLLLGGLVALALGVRRRA